MGGFVLLAAATGVTVGHARLAQPLQRLIREMHTIRSGSAATPIAERGDDEIVALAAAFNAMARELEAARTATAAEADARREAYGALQEANRLVTVGQLSAAVAHEIGSPMQVLLGRARSLTERAGDPDEVRRIGGILVRESERIVRIVSQLLSLTRAGPPRREAVELVAVARAVLVLLEIEARRRAVQVTVEGEPAIVVVDPDQLQQVLLNLLNNALQATGPGGRVTVRIAPSRPGARLEVADDGVGMDEATRARAFEPLFTTRPERGGAGLGLAIVRRIVQDHGGSVSVTSAEGRGTTVAVDLPGAIG